MKETILEESFSLQSDTATKSGSKPSLLESLGSWLFGVVALLMAKTLPIARSYLVLDVVSLLRGKTETDRDKTELIN